MISFLVPCVIILVASIPLMLGMIPPNRIYGFRTQQTLSNRELWLRVNRFAGFALFIAAGASVAVFVAIPEYASSRSLAGLAVFLVPLIVAVVASFAYLRRAQGKAAR